MRWLITTPSDANLEAIEQRLADLETELDRDIQPVPLGDSEQVLAVEGPSDLSQKLAGDSAILGIYPDSQYELYPGDPAATDPTPDEGSAERESPSCLDVHPVEPE